ncbi:MAG: lysophospholipid acyltransferase family protein [Candidatus Bruticola sp.]
MGFYERFAFKPMHFMTKAILSLMGGLKISGQENMPLTGGALLVCNHVSLSDPLMLLGTLPRPLYYMAASELFEIPYFNKLITALRAFPVKRGGNDLRAFSLCCRLLEAGEAVVMYPEGRLSSNPAVLGPLMPGAVSLAMRAQVPIYPIVELGTDKFFPREARWIHCAFKEVRFGPPLRFPPIDKNSSRSVKEQTEEANTLLRQSMLNLY